MSRLQLHGNLALVLVHLTPDPQWQGTELELRKPRWHCHWSAGWHSESHFTILRLGVFICNTGTNSIPISFEQCYKICRYYQQVKAEAHCESTGEEAHADVDPEAPALRIARRFHFLWMSRQSLLPASHIIIVIHLKETNKIPCKNNIIRMKHVTIAKLFLHVRWQIGVLKNITSHTAKLSMIPPFCKKFAPFWVLHTLLTVTTSLQIPSSLAHHLTFLC